MGWRPAKRLRHPVQMKETSSKGSARGMLISSAEQQDLQHWSELEHWVATILLADRTLKEVRCQATTVEYYDEDGELHTHRFDYTGVKHDGTEIHYAVKYSNQAHEVLRVFGFFEAQGVDINYCLVTEEMATLGRAQNADTFLTARENHVQADYLDALRSLEAVNGQVAFYDLLKNAPNIADRRVALTTMLDRGVLRAVHGLGKRVTDYTIVIIDHQRRLEELRRGQH